MLKNTETSTYYWFKDVLDPSNFQEKKILEKLKNETPSLISAIFERTCNLKCTHCLYAETKCSSQAISKINKFEEAIIGAAKNIPRQSKFGEMPQFLHSGRIIAPWHIEILSKIKRLRPDMSIGLIDNGSYFNHLEKFKKNNLKLNWIDISLDGDSVSHKKQRPGGRQDSFAMAINGLKSARELVEPDGYVASLFTMTRLNHQSIEKTADILFSKNPKHPDHRLADLMAITTIAPNKEEHLDLEVSRDARNIEEFKEAWEQIKRATKKYGSSKIILHLYRHHELKKIASVVGEEKFINAFRKSELHPHNIAFYVDGLKVLYSPLSTWPKEELVFDADAYVRTAFSTKYTLEEYVQAEKDNNQDILKYSIEKATAKTDYRKVYEKTAKQWWNTLGKNYLEEEKKIIRDIIRKAKRK